MHQCSVRHVIGVITLLLFIGATGKSAQIPLFVWLPDAMAGPTPVSALIHAATMVTAGVYMTARLHFLFALAPSTLALIAWIGAATAFFAATIALTQNDIKKVLAYSTVSQLGYMFLAVGMGAFGAAIFHVFTHAFFKACLFLGSGSVIHALDGEQDMRKMGGLKAHMPTTYWTYVDRDVGDRRRAFYGGFFLQGFNSVASLQPRRDGALGNRRDHGGHDGFLHVSPTVHGVSRRVPRRCSCQGASS